MYLTIRGSDACKSTPEQTKNPSVQIQFMIKKKEKKRSYFTHHKTINNKNNDEINRIKKGDRCKGKESVENW